MLVADETRTCGASTAGGVTSAAISRQNVVVVEPAPNTTSEECYTSIPTALPRFYPHWRGKPVYKGSSEALGWALDGSGRSVAFISTGAFLGPALLKLAKEAAGCDTTTPGAECNGQVYGIRPSSLLTTYSTIVGILSSVLLPVVGALIDYKPHRRLFGRTVSFLFCVFSFPQIFVSSDTWFAVAVVHLFVAFIGWAETLITYSYLPELTDSDVELAKLAQSFTIVNFGSMVMFLSAIIGVSTALGMQGDVVATARLAQAVSFIISCLMLYYAWGYLFQKRPAAHELPPSQSLWTAGFAQVYRTSIHIYHEYRALMWFLVSVAFTDSGVNSLATIAITYLTDTLAFNSQENGIAVLLMLLGSIPGALLGGRTIALVNPIFSSFLAALALMATTIAASIVLTGPGQQVATYIMAAVWGCGIGWKWTADRTLVAVITPEGQDTELMGIFLFAGQILTWLPPLIFTALNEAGVSQRVGLATLSIYFCIGMVALLFMGSYRYAVQLAGRMHLSGAINNRPNGGEVFHPDESAEIARDHSHSTMNDPEQQVMVRCTTPGTGVLTHS